MALGFVAGLRNSILSEISTLVDAGAAGGFIVLYDGARPATGGTATNEVATLQFSATAFGAPAAGVMTAAAITSDTNATGGTTTWFRVTDSDSTFVYDGSVGLVASGDDIELTAVVIPATTTVSISSYVINENNP